VTATFSEAEIAIFTKIVSVLQSIDAKTTPDGGSPLPRVPGFSRGPEPTELGPFGQFRR